MNLAPTTTRVDRQAAHLRVASDRAAVAAPAIDLSGVSKTYRSRDGDVPSLRPLDFHINDGEFFVVVGPSGCGKSTLLKLISGLLPPTSGEVLVEGEKVTKPHGCRHRVPERAAAALAQYPLQRDAADRHEAAAAGRISHPRQGASEAGRARRVREEAALAALRRHAAAC